MKGWFYRHIHLTTLAVLCALAAAGGAGTKWY